MSNKITEERLNNFWGAGIASRILKTKMDFTFFILVTMANLNGSSEDGRPREIDGYGISSNVCMNHKIRMALHEAGYDIFVLPQEDEPNNVGSLEEKVTALPGYKDMNTNDLIRALSDKYIDWRFFGGVGGFLTSTNKPKNVTVGSIGVPAAVSIQYGKTVAPVEIIDIPISNCIDVQKGSSSNRLGSQTVVKHGLYKINGSINVPNAEKSGFTKEDLEVFKQIIPNLFEATVSCARPSGSIVMKKAVFWNHDSRYGTHRSDQCFDKAVAVVKPGIDEPLRYEDYDITVGEFDDLKPEIIDF